MAARDALQTRAVLKKSVRMRSPLQKPDQRAFSISQTQHITSLSRPTIYRLLGSGRLKSVKVLNRRLILAEGIDALLREGAK